MSALDGLRTFLAAIQPYDTYVELKSLAVLFGRVAQYQIGSVTGTGVALDVTVNGDPKAVIVINSNDGTFGVKLYGMATSAGLKVNATGPAVTYAAANIVTLGTDKFTIGADAQLNTAHTLHWIAFF